MAWSRMEELIDKDGLLLKHQLSSPYSGVGIITSVYMYDRRSLVISYAEVAPKLLVLCLFSYAGCEEPKMNDTAVSPTNAEHGLLLGTAGSRYTFLLLRLFE